MGEAAGVSRGLAAHYFGNRDGFLVALADHITGSFGDGTSRVMRSASGLDRLLEQVGSYFDRAQRDVTLTRAAVAVQGDTTNEALKIKIRALNARGLLHIEDHIKAGIASGEIRKSVDAPAQAMLILSGMRGVVALWLAEPGSNDLGRFRNEFVASLKRNLAARAA